MRRIRPEFRGKAARPPDKWQPSYHLLVPSNPFQGDPRSARRQLVAAFHEARNDYLTFLAGPERAEDPTEYAERLGLLEKAKDDAARALEDFDEEHPGLT
jgi:hypothetical protein